MSAAFLLAESEGLDTTSNEVLQNSILPNALRISQQLGSSKKPGEVGSVERIRQEGFASLDKQLDKMGLPFALRDETGKYTPEAVAAVDDYVARVLGKVQDSPAPKKTVLDLEEKDD